MEYSKEHEAPFSSPSLPSNKWWSKDTVAIVTGANKGIGFAMVKRLAQLGLTVILTARDIEKGHKAIEELRNQGLDDVHFFRLDVSEPASINTFVSWFARIFGALDILKLKNPNIKNILQSENLSEKHIEAMVSSFLQNVKNGKWERQGWPELWTDYAVSKLALNAYTRVLAKRYMGRGISLNCFCPGFTQTSMTRGKGTHTADDAADIGARLALLPPEELPSGRFYLSGTSIVNSKL
nr:carbonyl reductase [nadph] 1 [Quercus suber]